MATPNRDFEFRALRWFGDVHAAEKAFFASVPGAIHRNEWLHLHPDDAAELVHSLGDPAARKVRHQPTL